MRTSREFINLLPDGAEARVHDRGMSYRAGGDIIVSRAGYWDNPVTVDVEDTGVECFDGTGYDGRGRHYQVWRLVPSDTGMIPISPGQWAQLSEVDRVMIGQEDKGAVYFGRPENDSKSDIAVALKGLGL